MCRNDDDAGALKARVLEKKWCISADSLSSLDVLTVEYLYLS